MIGSLMVARQMGVYAAGTVMGWATKSRQFLTGAAGGYAMSRTVGKIGVGLGEKEWVQKSYLASRAARAMAGTGARSLPFGVKMETMADKKRKRDEFETGRVEATTRKAMAEQIKDFDKSVNSAFNEAYVRNIIKDQKKLAEYLRAGGNQDKMLNVIRTKIGADAEKEFHKAVRAQKYSEDQAKTPGLTDNAFLNSLANDAEREEYFKDWSARQQAEVYAARQADPAELAKVQGWVSKLKPDDQIKFNDTVGRAMTQNIDELGKNWQNLPEEIKKIVSGAFSRDEVQKMAGKVADADKFYDDIAKYAPNRREDILAVLPAKALAGKTDQEKAEIVGKTELDKIPLSHAAANLSSLSKDIATNMRSKQLPKLIDRSDALTDAVLGEYQKMYDATEQNGKKSMERLAQAFEKLNNRGMANWIITAKNPKAVLGLK